MSWLCDADSQPTSGQVRVPAELGVAGATIASSSASSFPSADAHSPGRRSTRREAAEECCAYCVAGQAFACRGTAGRHRVLRPVRAVLRREERSAVDPEETYLRLFLKFRYRLGYESLSGGGRLDLLAAVLPQPAGYPGAARDVDEFARGEPSRAWSGASGSALRNRGQAAVQFDDRLIVDGESIIDRPGIRVLFKYLVEFRVRHTAMCGAICLRALQHMAGDIDVLRFYTRKRPPRRLRSDGLRLMIHDGTELSGGMAVTASVYDRTLAVPRGLAVDNGVLEQTLSGTTRLHPA